LSINTAASCYRGGDGTDLSQCPPEGSPSGRQLYVQYGIVRIYMFSTEHTFLPTRLLNPMHVRHTILYHTCLYNRLAEDEPSGSKHVEDIKNKKLKY